MRNKQFYVYILANDAFGTLYVGFTSDLQKRDYQHKHQIIKGFTSNYKVYKLVYFEVYEDALSAIQREKNLKHWKRDWKIELINKHNPE